MKTTVTMAEKIEKQTKEEQRILANNAWHLARYAIEHDHEIDFPDEFDVGKFLYWSENYPNLNQKEKIIIKESADSILHIYQIIGGPFGLPEKQADMRMKEQVIK